MSDLIETTLQEFTHIGEKTKIQGTLVFKGDTKVAGHIKGEIRIQGESSLSVEPTGELEGTIYCHNLSIYGHVIGDVRSTGTVTLFPSSFLEGQIQAANLVIHPGSTVNMEGKTQTEQAPV